MYEALKNAISLNRVEILTLLGAPEACTLESIQRRCAEKAFADEISIGMAIDELVKEGAIRYENGVATKIVPEAATIKKPKTPSLGMP